MPSKKEKQRLGREIARHERKIKAADEVQEISKWLLSEYNNAHPDLVISNLAKLERLSKEAGIPIKKEFRQALVDFRREISEVERDEFAVRRAIRLFVDALWSEGEKLHRIANVPKMCVQCNKRPAHFGDVCKRCAEESGIRPKGKV